MSIRRTFLILIVPLFLLLAAMNGALLFAWERAEAERGMEKQALAAAVTTAAFAASGRDLADVLRAPGRAAAIRAAAENVPGLEGLWIAAPGERPRRIAGSGPDIDPGRFAMPGKPVAKPAAVNPADRLVVTALAPANEGRFIIAQIDATPLRDQVAGLLRLIAVLVAGAGILGFVLAWTLARRIGGELARASAMIETIRNDGDEIGAEGLRIRETIDLANALRLMRTSVAGRVARNVRELAARDRRRDEAGSVAAYRETAFAPLSAVAAGHPVAARMMGQAAPGAFFALAVEGDRAALVVGECVADSPATALALAIAARRHFERRLLDGPPGACVDRARELFGVTGADWLGWSQEVAPDRSVLALLDGDNGARAEAYAGRATGLAPAAIVDDLAALLGANGVLAVVGPASGEAGQGRLRVGRDGEDG